MLHVMPVTAYQGEVGIRNAVSNQVVPVTTPVHDIAVTDWN